MIRPTLAFLVRWFWLALMLFPIQKSMAALQAVNFTADQMRASAVNTEGTIPIIYGGTAGTCSSSTDVCNSCENYSLGATSSCNTRRISDNLILRITFRIDSVDGAGPAMIAHKADGTVVASCGGCSTSSNVSKNQDAQVEVLWSDLCNAMKDNSSGCEGKNISDDFLVGIDGDNDGELSTAESGQVKIEVYDPSVGGTSTAGLQDECSKDNTQAGICIFEAYPGDEKVSIVDLDTGGNRFPVFSGVKFNQVRVYHSQTGLADAIPGKGSYRDIPFEEDTAENSFTLENKVIPDLTNGITYYFRIAVLDPALNVAFLTSDDNIADLCGSVGNPNEDCPYVATPDKVSGLLSEDLNCFISTAAFGSSYSEVVQIFRDYRNRFLTRTQWGQALIKTYYKYGPYGARWLSQNPEFKPLVQLALLPAAGTAWMILNFGYLGLFAGLFTLMIVFFSLYHLRHSQKVESRNL